MKFKSFNSGVGSVRMRVNREVAKLILLNFFIKHLRCSII